MNSNGNCLVVGDDLDIQGLLCLILSSDSFKVRAEATGAAGLQAARHRILRTRKLSAARILTITASPDPGRGTDQAAGVVAYLTKPLRLALLVEPAQQLCPQVPAAQPIAGQVRS